MSDESCRDGECSCQKCFDAHFGYRDVEKEVMAESHWICHIRSRGAATPTGFCCHTHGLEENFGHPDLQMVMRCCPATAHAIVCAVVGRIVVEGDDYRSGDVLEGILQGGYLIKMVGAEQGGRRVLRMILPDTDGVLDPSRMSKRFRKQYADIEGAA